MDDVVSELSATDEELGEEALLGEDPVLPLNHILQIWSVKKNCQVA